VSKVVSVPCSQPLGHAWHYYCNPLMSVEVRCPGRAFDCPLGWRPLWLVDLRIYVVGLPW
jgi:hypothetical protein